MKKLKKFTLKVEVFTEANATKPAFRVMEDVINSCIGHGLTDHKVRLQSCEDVTEQGYKVWRGRVKGEKVSPVKKAARASQKYLKNQRMFEEMMDI